MAPVWEDAKCPWAAESYASIMGFTSKFFNNELLSEQIHALVVQFDKVLRTQAITLDDMVKRHVTPFANLVEGVLDAVPLNEENCTAYDYDGLRYTYVIWQLMFKFYGTNNELLDRLRACIVEACNTPWSDDYTLDI